jgi:DNA-binding NarL/FixJ family response regulator
LPFGDHTTTVLIVEDHAFVRRSLRRQCEDEPDLRVVAETGNAEEAVRLVRRFNPHVVIMDFALPGRTGAFAAQQILKHAPRTAVLFLSMHSESIYVRAAFDSGARGYLLKSADLELATAVRAVANGHEVIDPKLEMPPILYRYPNRPLTVRELEVLRLVAEGKSNKEIARLLGIATGTVAVHRANIMQHLGAHKTAKIALYAMVRGLLDDEVSDHAERRNRKRKKGE